MIKIVAIIGLILAIIALIIYTGPKEGLWGHMGALGGKASAWGLPDPVRYNAGPMVIKGGTARILQPPFGAKVTCVGNSMIAPVIVPNTDYVYGQGGSLWESCELCPSPIVCQDCPNINTPGLDAYH
jgi:hypothetical protein